MAWSHSGTARPSLTRALKAAISYVVVSFLDHSQTPNRVGSAFIP